MTCYSNSHVIILTVTATPHATVTVTLSSWQWLSQHTLVPTIPWLAGTAFKEPKTSLFFECGPWVISITVYVSCYKPSHNNGLHSNGLLSQDIAGYSTANSLWTVRMNVTIRTLQERSSWKTREIALHHFKKPGWNPCPSPIMWLPPPCSLLSRYTYSSYNLKRKVTLKKEIKMYWHK